MEKKIIALERGIQSIKMFSLMQIKDIDLSDKDVVWGNKSRSEFIESVIMNLPVPFVTFIEDNEHNLEIVDGAQRLAALKDFYSDKITLEGLTFLKELNGKTFSGLPEETKESYEERKMYLNVILCDNKDKEEMKVIARKRLNK